MSFLRLGLAAVLLNLVLAGACHQSEESSGRPVPAMSTLEKVTDLEVVGEAEEKGDLSMAEQTAVRADVTAVSVSGGAGAYTFNVTVRSPDTGCERYADWWEVLSPKGELIYRRVLLHSHVGEQPFTRSGGPVNIQPEETVIVRAHMNTTGYGGNALQGSASGGFKQTALSEGSAAGLEREGPQPSSCAF